MLAERWRNLLTSCINATRNARGVSRILLQQMIRQQPDDKHHLGAIPMQMTCIVANIQVIESTDWTLGRLCG